MTPTRPRLNASAPESALPWEHWQTSRVCEKYLPLDARQMGYTVVRVHPACRAAFLEMVALFNAYGRLASRKRCPDDVSRAWQTWAHWTRRLRHCLERLLVSQPATLPPVPAPLATLDDTGSTPDGC
jgi:hypothetical protein